MKIISPRTIFFMLLCVFCPSFVGLLIFPTIFEYAIEHGSIFSQSFLQASLFVLGAVIISVTSFLLGARGVSVLPERKGKKLHFFMHLLGLYFLIFLILICVTGISFLYGFLSVALMKAFENSLSLEQIKGLVNIFTQFLTLLILPVFVSVILHFSLEGSSVLSSIKAGIKRLRRNYFRILLTLLLITAAGFLITIPTNYIKADVVANWVKIGLFTLVGAVSIVLLVFVYARSVERIEEGDGK